MNRKRISEISTRELLIIAIPTLLIGLLVFGVAYHYVLPAPPRTLVMTTGMTGGSSEAFGERYRRFLARDQVHLDLRPSEGSVENLKRLTDRSTGVDVGFVMGGSGSGAETKLVSLGAICYMPFWVFYRGDRLDIYVQPLNLHLRSVPGASHLKPGQEVWLELPTRHLEALGE